MARTTAGELLDIVARLTRCDRRTKERVYKWLKDELATGTPPTEEKGEQEG